MKILDKINYFVGICAALITMIMTVLVLVGIVCRYCLGVPFPEGQELAIYAMVYVVMLGSTYAVYNKTHIAVTFLVEKFPLNLRLFVRLLSYVAMLIFFYILLDYGWTLTQRSMLQMSPSTGIPVGYVVISLPFAAALSIIYVIKQIIEEFQNYRNGKQR